MRHNRIGRILGGKTLRAGAFASTAIKGLAIASITLLSATTNAAETGVSYRHYRFKVNAVFGPNASQLELSKIGLFCEGKELAYTCASVSRGPATSAYGTTSPARTGQLAQSLADGFSKRATTARRGFFLTSERTNT